MYFNDLLIMDCVEKRQWVLLREELNKYFKIKLDTEGKPISLDIKDKDIKTLNDVLLSVVGPKNYKKDPEIVNIIKEIFKALRNAVAFNFSIQNYIVKETIILQKTHEILLNLYDESELHVIACVKMLLQFLVNEIVNNADSGHCVWEVFGDLINNLIKMDSFSYTTAALFYNVLCNNEKLVFEPQLINSILDLCNDCDNEYLEFILEHFLRHDNLCNDYLNLKTEHRIILLEIIKENFLNNKKSSYLLTSKLMKILLHQFKIKSDCILKTVTDNLNQIEPYEVALLLDILSSASAEEMYLSDLQNDNNLLITCAFLLKSIHALGKESDNNFTSIQKLSMVTDTNNMLQNHPAFGFKADLIRILGNLSWKHKVNQDELRQLDCIPLLLDCCNIDARNPFIIQWTIFTIRNLCENNAANQQVIEEMTKVGTVSSATLQEMGITVHGDSENKLTIVPLDAIKK